MDPIRERINLETRRSFFGRAGVLGVGAMALADLMAREGIAVNTRICRNGAPLLI